ncbi:hypothetical protein VNO78_29043 [Psophocarpus tetragonolobus]|uniref:Uncharacterized protein n=1 Tax=Psophocarpus tetragonolobus TaxID=3891 RepID=A0AAN9RUS1_PSOTE
MMSSLRKAMKDVAKERDVVVVAGVIIFLDSLVDPQHCRKLLTSAVDAAIVKIMKSASWFKIGTAADVIIVGVGRETYNSCLEMLQVLLLKTSI